MFEIAFPDRIWVIEKIMFDHFVLHSLEDDTAVARDYFAFLSYLAHIMKTIIS